MVVERKSRSVLRICAAIFAVLFIVAGLFFATVYLLLFGSQDKTYTLHSNIESSLEEFAGPNFDVRLGSTKLTFADTGLLSVAVDELVLVKSGSNQVFVQLEDIRLGAKIWETLAGTPSFDKITADRAWVDVSAFVPGVGLPTHLGTIIGSLGEQLNAISAHASAGAFKSLQISNVEFLTNARSKTSDLLMSQFLLEGDNDGALQFDTQLKSAKSNIKLVAAYDIEGNRESSLKLEVAGLSIGEWMPGPQEVDGRFGSDAVFRISGNMPFDAEGIPQQSLITVTPSPGAFRWGRVVTPLDDFKANLRIIPEQNQIELERSILKAGRLSASLLGGIRPTDKELGYAGPLQYELIAETASVTPVLEEEVAEPAAFSFGGLWEPDKKVLRLDRGFMLTRDGRIDGNAAFDFSKGLPAVKASANSEQISMVTLRQFWPIFIASGARNWVQNNVTDGVFKSLSLEMDAPSGIVGQIRSGAKFDKKQLKIRANFNDAAFNTTGDLPGIKDGVGTLSIDGMVFEANLSKGRAAGNHKARVDVTNSKFTVSDFGVVPAMVRTEVILDGPLRTLAAFSNRKPLQVMDRIKTKSGGLSGKAHADVVANFPLRRGLKESDVVWNALVDLKGAASRNKLSGRSISDANILIEANPQVARIKGSAKIDGIPSRLTIVEPLGKKSKFKRSRVLTAKLSKSMQAKVGLNLSPVINGPLDLKVEQKQGKAEVQHLDLTQAEINLPWVGWRKSKGIAAKASYTLTTSKGINRFNNFSISGASFGASGKLAFDNAGILSADLGKISLNKGDDFDLRIRKVKGVYELTTTGASFDTRGILNKLIHEGDFTEEQADTSVRVNGRIANLRGYNNRTIQNAKISYVTRKGKLQSMKIEGVSPQNATMYAAAGVTGENSGFEFKSKDAGYALSFTGLYSRMRGGEFYSALRKVGSGPYSGLVKVENFEVVDEPRLQRLVRTTKRDLSNDRDEQFTRQLERVQENRVRFGLARANIVKGEGFLTARDGLVRNNTIGLSYEGTVYDKNNRMNISGTFMPAIVINRAVSAIPIIGQLLGNARDSAFIGISYRLKGPMSKPVLDVNPISLVTPGIFNKVFEFKK